VDFGFWIVDFGFGGACFNPESKIQNQKSDDMAAIVQWLERLIVVQDVEGSNPSSRPTSLF
jgi:hypothetical protein